jgi:agmatinase
MPQPTVPPLNDAPTFLDFPLCEDLDSLEPGIAILGIPFSYHYAGDQSPWPQDEAPAAVRQASARLSVGPDHWDFDVGGPVLGGKTVPVVDCGDAGGEASDPGGHYGCAEEAIRRILACGALPITIGGDHGVPIPVFRALRDQGPVTLVHVDAHLDWRNDVGGVTEGYSSPIRRASELDWIDGIYQLGLRAQGSARAEEVEAAKAYGSEIFTAYYVHDRGIAAILERIPDGGTYYLTIDADGLDPTVMPAVLAPAPGGLSFEQVR